MLIVRFIILSWATTRVGLHVLTLKKMHPFSHMVRCSETVFCLKHYVFAPVALRTSKTTSKCVRKKSGCMLKGSRVS